MNKKALFLFIGILIATMLATTISLAGAATPTSIGGSWLITPGPFDQTIVGNSNNIIRTSEDTVALTGDISGMGMYERRLTIHNVGPDFWITQQGVITIEATVNGNLGTLVIKTVANSQKSTDGQWSIISGTDDLANLHGQGTFDHVTPLLFIFEGEIHFDP